MERIIDLTLFNPEPFCFKTKTCTYKISFVSSVMEYELLTEQENILAKTKSFKSLNKEDLAKWSAMIKKIIRENGSTLDDKDIDSLSPLELITFILALINYLNKKSDLLKQAFEPEVQEQMKTIEKELKDGIKKKTMESA